jgi:hypothetical protein
MIEPMLASAVEVIALVDALLVSSASAEQHPVDHVLQRRPRGAGLEGLPRPGHSRVRLPSTYS